MILFLAAMFLAPRLFGIHPYVVTSGSMEPEYPVGSMIYVQQVLPNEIAVGDAITFIPTGSESAATHQVRLIDQENGQVYTQGINNKDEDGNILPDAEPVPYDAIIGKPLICIPGLGNVNRFCTTFPGIVIVVSGVFAVILVSVLLERTVPDAPAKRRKKRKRRRRN